MASRMEILWYLYPSSYRYQLTISYYVWFFLPDHRGENMEKFVGGRKWSDISDTLLNWGAYQNNWDGFLNGQMDIHTRSLEHLRFHCSRIRLDKCNSRQCKFIGVPRASNFTSSSKHTRSESNEIPDPINIKIVARTFQCCLVARIYDFDFCHNWSEFTSRNIVLEM